MKRNVLAALAACCAALIAQAQPAASPGPVKLIVSTTPGAGMDITTRLVAEKLSAMWQRQVVVENKPGASGVIAVTAFKTTTDPNTFLVADIGVASINPSLLKQTPYEPRTDFVPVTDIFQTSFFFFVRPDRYDSLGKLMSAARAKPGQLNFGAAGSGSGQRLSVELFKAQSGLDLTFIPYKGNSEAITALLSGDVDLVSVGLPPALAHLAAGKLKGIATTGTGRSPVMPDIPAVAETVKGYASDTWVGVFAKPKTPPSVVKQMQSDIARVMRDPDVQAFYRRNDYQAGGSPSPAFAQRVEADRGKYRALIESAKIVAE